ncbi:MAG: threonine--tRNA ligase [Dehalococcoidales bacterium]|nr:threonine--tRNA ligase [Dehalococcoidales bacterium]
MDDEKEKTDNAEKLDMMRHSAAHVMAEAVQSMFPDTKFGIGPTIEDGFYYDFDLPRSLTPEDLPVIEAKMKEIVKSNSPFTKELVTKDEARKLFTNQPYKLELIDELPEEQVTIYRQGNFVDMCRGPHVRYTSAIKTFKLMSIAGAYWRGSEKNPMLQRIYAIAFSNQKELDAYLAKIEEAKRRDHRKLGKDLDLFLIPEEIGGGLVVYTPKGGRIRSTIEDFWRKEHFSNGYEILYTPHIGLSKLWETSGHLGFYKENMYSPITIDEQDYYLKPMNCPFHILAYKSRIRSYRELPLRWAELGTVYRYEMSGVLSGLMRVRGFTQDDAHIFCTPEQMNDEISEVLRFSLHMLDTFGFPKYKVYLSTRPKDAVGEPQKWEDAQNALRRVLEENRLEYNVDEGGGAFYGPKIDLKIEDALGREWQTTTIQFDFNLPERFDMAYIGADGKEHQPYMIHRALFGSWERFFGLLIEHYIGAFPVWLAPVQAVIIPISDQHVDYARKVEAELKTADVRVQVDNRNERMNQKIREAQLQKIPYMLIVGDKEMADNAVSVRLRTGEQLPMMPLDAFKTKIRQMITERINELKP